MATIALIGIGVLALLVAVLFGALVELFRDVRQLRDAVGILDRPLIVDLGSAAGTKPSAYGLPRHLDSTASAIVLFLSERCATCRVLATGLGRPIPEGLWIILDARGPSFATAFLEQSGLTAADADGRVIVDVGGGIFESLGLNTTPLGLRVEHGVITHATTVPSSRYLTSILPEPIRLRRAG